MKVPLIAYETNSNITLGIAFLSPPEISMFLNPIIIFFLNLISAIAFVLGDIAIVRVFIVCIFKSNKLLPLAWPRQSKHWTVSRLQDNLHPFDSRWRNYCKHHFDSVCFWQFVDNQFSLGTVGACDTERCVLGDHTATRNLPKPNEQQLVCARWSFLIASSSVLESWQDKECSLGWLQGYHPLQSPRRCYPKLNVILHYN